MAQHPFPDSFLWGVATSAYQVEGATQSGGRGESIWDRFAQTSGKIRDGSTTDVACDHYHRYREDVKLMQELGVRAYRFSLAWPRILPQGKGQVNPAGLDFYDRLIDSLLGAGIEPFVTLYHWDLPQALQENGGWANRETAKAFVDYAAVACRRLGDRVQYWTTHNEPWCTALVGHYLGVHAPGEQSLSLGLQTAHHVLLSHGLAVPVLRELVHNAQIGIALNLTPAQPLTDKKADIDATQRFDGYFNRWFLDPIAGKGYPQDMLDYYGKAKPQVSDGDLQVISAPIDFLGVNYYMRGIIQDDPDGRPPQALQTHPEHSQYTAMDWEIHPEGLYEILRRVHDDYGFAKIYITENGAAFDDRVDTWGKIDDGRRVDYLEKHIEQAGRALQEGVPLHGYFVWSLMDNFEWSEGYTKRFGLVFVDYPTQKRIIKKSGYWFRDFISG